MPSRNHNDNHRFWAQGAVRGRHEGRHPETLPEARVIDLAHDIPAQWPPEAGFWVRRSYEYFPDGSVHLAIVDPGVGKEREILIVEYDGHMFMATENGLLAALLDTATDAHVYHLSPDRLAAIGVGQPSATFHGRDFLRRWRPSWLPGGANRRPRYTCRELDTGLAGRAHGR